MKTNNKVNSQQLIARVKAAIASAALVGTLGGWLIFGSQSQTAATVAMNSVDPLSVITSPSTLPTQTTSTASTSVGTTSSSQSTTTSNAGTAASTNQSTTVASTGTTASTNQNTSTTTTSTRQRSVVTTTRSSK